jgi:hypothetical protein
MSRPTFKQVLMSRDGMSESEADAEVAEAKIDLASAIDDDPMSAMDFMEQYGLEPDYLEDLI